MFFSKCPLAAIGLLAFIPVLLEMAHASEPAQADKPEPALEAHFHHLHLNTLDPAAAIDFYTSKFDCEKAKYQGAQDAVWAQKSWLLFSKVDSPPPWELISAIWHFGWGAEDMKATYEKQLKMKTKFFTPITNVFSPTFFYAYVDGPDHALIELNTAKHHHFGHLHLFSDDPVAAGEWYMKYTGAKRNAKQTETRLYRGFQIAPMTSLMLDNVNIIIYPIQYSKQAYAEHWKGHTQIVSTKGRTVDHVGISYANLADALEHFRKDGVKITEEITTSDPGKVKHAFIEGPDKIRIELIEGHARKE